MIGRRSYHVDEPGAAPMRVIEWRGWIAVVWAVIWGAAYALMAIEARAPLLRHWLDQLAAAFPDRH